MVKISDWNGRAGGRRDVGCGKWGYIRRSDAKAALKRIKKLPEERSDPRVLSVYWCEACSGWHVGHLWPHQIRSRQSLDIVEQPTL